MRRSGTSPAGSICGLILGVSNTITDASCSPRWRQFVCKHLGNQVHQPARIAGRLNPPGKFIHLNSALPVDLICRIHLGIPGRAVLGTEERDWQQGREEHQASVHDRASSFQRKCMAQTTPASLYGICELATSIHRWLRRRGNPAGRPRSEITWERLERSRQTVRIALRPCAAV